MFPNSAVPEPIRAVVWSDLYQHSLVRVQLSAGDIDSVFRCHARFENEMTRLQIRHKNGRGINRRKPLAERIIDGKSLVVVQCENVSTQVCETDAALVVEIKGGEKQSSIRFDLNDELLFSVNLDDAVGAAKNVGSDPQLKSWFGEYSCRCRTTKGFGPTGRH